MSVFDSILLIAFGGPEKPEEIRPFLEVVTAGRNIPKDRIEEVTHHYELMGGRSPLNELTFRQAGALARLLADDGIPLPVYVGMRNWHPFLHETLTEMKNKGHRRSLGIILSAFQAEASWDRYMSDVGVACGKVGRGAPEVSFTSGWASHPLFIDAVATTLTGALSEVTPAKQKATPVVFTAHSIPKSMAEGSQYTSQFTAAARAVAEGVGQPNWSVAYQSRSGSPRDPWLEPDICDVLRDLPKKGCEDVVVVPIGFVCEHVEVQYDLDLEARKVAEKIGLCFHRATAVNDHPIFVGMLADLVKKEMKAVGPTAR
jgi:ferrochelatase